MGWSSSASQRCSGRRVAPFTRCACTLITMACCTSSSVPTSSGPTVLLPNRLLCRPAGSPALWQFFPQTEFASNGVLAVNMYLVPRISKNHAIVRCPRPMLALWCYQNLQKPMNINENALWCYVMKSSPAEKCTRIMKNQ